MKKIIDLIEAEVVKAFEAAEIDTKFAKVSLSNRPDLCEYQCNGAMAAAKEYKKAQKLARKNGTEATENTEAEEK